MGVQLRELTGTMDQWLTCIFYLKILIGRFFFKTETESKFLTTWRRVWECDVGLGELFCLGGALLGAYGLLCGCLGVEII